MKQEIFTVFDEKAQAFLAPFFMGQLGQAKRIFTDCINSKDHQFGNHPHDYTLFHVGSFDDNTAEFVTPAKISLGNGVEYISLELGPEDPPDGQQIGNETLLSGAKSGNSA